MSRDQTGVVDFEVLVRRNTADYGPISPATFIPIAEGSTTIHEFGDGIPDAALTEMARWPGQYVSVSFSPREVRQRAF